ncbi:MAG: universal stress protein [Candidatus Hydrothermarchaeota archaeon]
MKKLLVPVDGSEYSKHAILEAGKLAERFGAKVSVLHVKPGVLVSPIYKSKEELAEDAKKVAQRSCAGLKRKKVRVEALGLVGDAATEILEMAKRGGYDLIIVGSKGLTDSKKFPQGSVSRKVVEQAPCNVLIVR